jgi:hypothetical protein
MRPYLVNTRLTKGETAVSDITSTTGTPDELIESALDKVTGGDTKTTTKKTTTPTTKVETYLQIELQDTLISSY